MECASRLLSAMPSHFTRTNTVVLQAAILTVVVVSRCSCQLPPTTQPPPPPPSCPYTHSNAAGLSSDYATNDVDSVPNLPKLLAKPPPHPVNSTPWWGNSTRSSYAEELTITLVQEIQQLRQNATGQPPAKRRRKRSSDYLSRSITECYAKNTATSFGTYRICAECNVVTTLDVDRNPRYISEVVCDTDTDDPGGFTGEGNCVDKTVDITVQKYKSDGSSYEELVYSMGTGCEVQLYKDSILMSLA